MSRVNARNGENPNRFKKTDGASRVSAQPLVDLYGEGSAVSFIWNNGLSATFPSKQRLVEDEFRKAQVLHILNGEVNENFSASRPEPLFGFSLEPVMKMTNKERKAKHVEDPTFVEPEYDQPDCDVSRSQPAHKLRHLTDVDVYYQRLSFFNSTRSAWNKERVEHDALVLRANKLFDRVFGARTLSLVLDVRRKRGMAAAWEHVKSLYTPKETHLVLSIVRAKWNKLRKYPKTPMLEFFAEFKAKRSQLDDVGRMPDSVDQFERLKEALLFDDVNWKTNWSPVVREVLRDFPVRDDACMHHLEMALTNRGTELELEKIAADNFGTYSSLHRDQPPRPPRTVGQLRHRGVQPGGDCGSAQVFRLGLLVHDVTTDRRAH